MKKEVRSRFGPKFMILQSYMKSYRMSCKNGRSAERSAGGGTNQIQFTERSMDWRLCSLPLSVEHM
jgi:hypothetical protein